MTNNQKKIVLSELVSQNYHEEYRSVLFTMSHTDIYIYRYTYIASFRLSPSEVHITKY